jgi:hypothetical protein
MIVTEEPRQATTDLPAAHGVSAEALIREARRRQRRRWLFVSLVIVVVAAACATGLTLSHGPSGNAPPSATKGPVPPTTLARCGVGSLSVGTLGWQTELGWNYQAFLVHNLSVSPCSVPAGSLTLRPYWLVGGNQTFLPYVHSAYSCTPGISSGLQDCNKPVVLAGHGFASFAVATGEGTDPCQRADGFVVKLPGVTGTIKVPRGIGGYCHSIRVGGLFSGCGAQPAGSFAPSPDARSACRQAKE